MSRDSLEELLLLSKSLSEKNRAKIIYALK